MSSMLRTIERGNKFVPLYGPNWMRIRWRKRAAERQSEIIARHARSDYGTVLSRIRDFPGSPMNPFTALAPLISSIKRFFTPKSSKGR